MQTQTNITINYGESIQVPAKSAFRVMDRSDYITVDGLSVFPGESPDPEQIRICEEWLKLFCRRHKNINKRAISYSLKHQVEAYHGRRVYVSNGALIKAAVNLGYQFRGIDNSPNCCFNMSMEGW